jgi:two-component system, cell cycle sensor histidine kinase and response regulator CckA
MQLHDFLDYISDVLYTLDQEWRFTYLNRAAEVLSGQSRDQLLGENLFEVWPGLRDTGLAGQFRRALEEQTSVHFEEQSILSDRWFAVHAYPYADGLIVYCRDITEQRHLLQAQQSTRNMLQLVMDNIPQGIFWKDRHSVYLGVNRACCDAMGFASAEEVIGKADNEFPSFTPEQSNFFMQTDRRVMETDTPEYHILEPMNRADGTTAWLDTSKIPLHNASGEVIGLLGMWEDITERKKLQEQLLQAQKMEGIGRLAGGIAHDFNNLLTAVLGYAEMAMLTLESGHAIQRDLQNIVHAGTRAADLTRQLLAFARKQIIEPHVVDMNRLVAEMDMLLRRVIGEDIELVTLSQKDLWPVKIDPGQFEQILVNLAVNARDAMLEGGKLTLETANVFLDMDYAHGHHEVVPGAYVLLAVSDTGVGIDPAILPHIFEPFYTTKGYSKGTGLGLATCHGIVKQHGGHIWVYSEPDAGTVFKIYLPRVQEAVEALSPPPPEVPVPNGTETVLLVEDDSMVRDMAANVLRSRGYTLLEAGNGNAALALAKSHRGDIHLLVTDVVMPQMSGKTLAEILSAERPGLRVLYCSGYTDNAIVHHGVLDPGIAFLQKPYTPASLARKVRETIDTKDEG